MIQTLPPPADDRTPADIVRLGISHAEFAVLESWLEEANGPWCACFERDCDGEASVVVLARAAAAMDALPCFLLDRVAGRIRLSLVHGDTFHALGTFGSMVTAGEALLRAIAGLPG